MTTETPSPTPVTPPPAQPLPPAANGKRNHLLVWMTIGLLVAGLIWFLLWFFYFQYYESTDDAYANGNMISLNSSISGSVAAFYIDDTSFVREGQLLVELDSTKYWIDYEKELAELGSQALQVRQLYDNAFARRADVENKRIGVQQARYDYENRQALIDTLAVSGEDFTHSKNTMLMAETLFKEAEYNLSAAEDLAGNTPWQTHPILEVQKNRVRQAYYNLCHCAIYAPTDGYVAQRAVDVGQAVSPQTNLLAIIPTEGLWVDANYKETQLTYMRVGQPVTVWFDLYGSGIKFKGTVLGIASGTGSVFSLLPPQNATGNWIKIVQRLPVRVSLSAEDLKKYPIRLGLSANVSVDITDTSLPMLTPPAKPAAILTTTVYQLNFEEAEKAIEAIIQANSLQVD